MTLYAIIAGIVAGALAIWRAYASGKSAGRGEVEKANADAYSQHIQDVSDAAIARNNASELPEDKYRRD